VIAMQTPGTHLREIFTIGHSNHDLACFMGLLRKHNITAIADVRSQPYSQYSSQFNREPLERLMNSNGILYGFAGAELGARRAEAECYRGGKARYDLVARLPLFQKGLARIRHAAESHRIALMCAEKDPITCHRMILVCRNLRSPGLAIRHILEDGSAETNDQAESRLLSLMGLPEGNLFQSRAELIEQAYDLQGEKIAYSDEPAGEAVLGGRQDVV
jgi:uncharacterized protein (DUF488 family)